MRTLSDSIGIPTKNLLSKSAPTIGGRKSRNKNPMNEMRQILNAQSDLPIIKGLIRISDASPPTVDSVCSGLRSTLDIWFSNYTYWMLPEFFKQQSARLGRSRGGARLCRGRCRS